MSRATGYEKTDAHPRITFTAAGILVLVIIAVGLICRLHLYILSRIDSRTPQTLSQYTPFPPEPRLEANPREDLQALHAEEDHLLETEGWTNGVQHISIEHAMDQLAEQGLPARQNGKQP